jgi:hypothetical protein
MSNVETMTEHDVFKFYQDKFKPIYADLVAVSAKKSLVVDAQIESAMSHLAVGKTSDDSSVLQENIDSAYGHIARACLDAAKLLWLDRFKRVNEIMNDPLKRKWCSTVSNGGLLTLYHEGERLIKNARRQDAAVAGHTSSELVDAYYDAISKFQQILDSMDWERMDDLKAFRFGYIVRQQFVGFVLGVAASLIASFIYTEVTAKAAVVKTSSQSNTSP